MNHNIRRRRTLEKMFRKQKGRCHYCLKACDMPPSGDNDGRVIPDNEFTRDHMLARALGGADKPENIVGACRSCNQDKANVEYLAAERKRASAGIVREMEP